MSERTARSRDYYTLLGVGREAGDDEIRRAFRSLVRRLHPDVNRAPDAAERFSAVVRAYETLTNPEQRRAYDREHQRSATRGPNDFGSVSPFVASQGQAAYTSGSSGSPRAASEAFSSAKGLRTVQQGGAPRGGALRGLDVHHTVFLSLTEAARGTSKTVAVPRREICILCRGLGAAPEGTAHTCPTCHGSGRGRSGNDNCPTCGGGGTVVDIPCRGCGGTGRRQGIFELEGVRFPAGLPSVGYTRRIKGEGEPGPLGGPRGELLLHVQIDDEPTLRRVAPESADVRSDLTISADQARRGGRIEVRTIYGLTALRLPPGVSSGTTYTLRGKGLRRTRQFSKGNQIVTVHVA